MHEFKPMYVGFGVWSAKRLTDDVTSENLVGVLLNDLQVLKGMISVSYHSWASS